MNNTTIITESAEVPFETIRSKMGSVRTTAGIAMMQAAFTRANNKYKRLKKVTGWILDHVDETLYFFEHQHGKEVITMASKKCAKKAAPKKVAAKPCKGKCKK